MSFKEPSPPRRAVISLRLWHGRGVFVMKYNLDFVFFNVGVGADVTVGMFAHTRDGVGQKPTR